jgi:hypothetical protein
MLFATGGCTSRHPRRPAARRPRSRQRRFSLPAAIAVSRRSVPASFHRPRRNRTSAITTAQLISRFPKCITWACRRLAGQWRQQQYHLWFVGESARIGPYATLTLLNGRRPVPQGTSGQHRSVDRADSRWSGSRSRRRRVSHLWFGCCRRRLTSSCAGAEGAGLRPLLHGDHNDRSVGAIFATTGLTGGIRGHRAAITVAKIAIYRANQTAQGGATQRDLCNPGNIVIAGAACHSGRWRHRPPPRP